MVRWLAAILAIVSTSPVQAQTNPAAVERTIPQLDARRTGPPSRLPAPAAPIEGAQVEGTFVLGAVNIEGATVFSPSELAASFEPYLAMRVGQAELNKIVADITDRYRRAGYLLSYAVLPEQSVESGIVSIRVIEGLISSVRVVGDARLASAVRPVAERLMSDRPLRAASLERSLAIIRDLPGVTVKDATLARSEADPARNELTVTIRGRRIRGVAYTDNRGTVAGARMRGYSSISYASLLVPGDEAQLDLFSIPSDDFRYNYAQVKASIPLNADGLRLAVSASRGHQLDRLAGPDQHGSVRQLIGEILYPFISSRTQEVTGHFSITDWKSRERRGGVTFQGDRLQVVRAWLEIAHVGKDRLDARLGISRGLGLGSVTRPGDPLASRPFGSPTFTKLNADIQYVTPVKDRFFLRFDGSAQFSTKSLLIAEEFALGGSRIGRAYDFNEATGDDGVGAMAELNYRISDMKSGLVKSVDLFGYADGGGAFRKRSSPGLARERWLASVGGGMRFSALGMSWSGELGLPLHRAHSGRHVRAFFSVARAL